VSVRASADDEFDEVRPAEGGGAFVFGGDEGGHVDQVTETGRAGDHGAAVGMAQDDRWPAHGVNDLLHGGRSGGQRSAMEFWDGHLHACVSEPPRNLVEVARLLPQAMDQDH
jgi:hypothetical protein